MYRPHHHQQQFAPIALMALAISYVACGTPIAFLSLSTNGASYPVSKNGTRGTAAYRRVAAMKAAKKLRSSCRKK